MYVCVCGCVSMCIKFYVALAWVCCLCLKPNEKVNSIKLAKMNNTLPELHFLKGNCVRPNSTKIESAR